MSAAALMTAEEFLALPWDDTRAQQLVDGEVVVNDPSRMHNGSQGVVFVALASWTREEPGRGWVALPLDVLVDERSVYKPGVAWYGAGRAPRRRDPRPYAVPDLAVEVRSPSTWRLDIGAKKAGYERAGVAELWLVDTAADVVLVFRRSRPDAPRFDASLELGAGDTLRSPLLPGFALAVSAIFELEP